MDLKNKVIILTGAARIGIDVGKTLLNQGAKLAVTYLNNKPDLGDVLYLHGDLSKPDDVDKIVAETKKQFGKIDGLIHMAAIYPRTPWATVNEKDWDTNMNVIAKSAFLIAKAVSKEMTEGKMIFISDWSVLDQPYKDYLPYNVAKSAVVGLTKSLAKELAPKISVNAIAPGPILMPPDLSKEDNDEVMKNTPLQKWGGEHEISKAILYLLDADFVTGQILYVDGGRSIA
ncbi:MAG: SDR family oxidoreductase [Candidatus Doudnabacteria bacterium]|nr:SDR family oxidoreductase [Candidatus Doudnabacteria bacterium]